MKSWLQRVCLVPRIRIRNRVRRFRCSPVAVYAVGCSPEESDQIRTVVQSDVHRLIARIKAYTDAAGNIRPLRVLCFGRSVGLNAVPSYAARHVDRNRASGVWIRELRAAIALFSDSLSIRQIVTHELAHGLLDVMTDGFPYPMAIQEGVACAMQNIVCAGNPREDAQSGDEVSAVRSERYLDGDYCMSAKELLLDPRGYWTCGSEQLPRMTFLSFWLNAYLARLSRAQPVLRKLPASLRADNVRTREGVYRWLLEASAMTEEEFERGFRGFCTTGEIDGQPE